MSDNLLSIIIPIYNSEKWLDRCLKSIVNQKYQKFEVIMVDDGSYDKSSEIYTKYLNDDERFKVIIKKNGGVSSARNRGIKEAKGDFIHFLDSDDWVEENMYNTCISNMLNNNLDLFICGLNIIKNNKILRTPSLDSRILSINKNEEDLKYVLKILNSPCNKIYRKRLILREFDESLYLGEDMLFNLNYLRNCDLTGVINECLYNVCLDNNNSLNRIYKENRLENLLLLFESELKIYEEFYGKIDDYFWSKRIFNTIGSELLQAQKILNKSECIKLIKRIELNSFVIDLINNSGKMGIKIEFFKKLLSRKKSIITYYFLKLMNIFLDFMVNRKSKGN